MLNSAERKLLNAHKYENIKKFEHFSGSDKPVMLFLLFINVKIPTWHFYIYEQEKYHAKIYYFRKFMLFKELCAGIICI